MDNIFRIARTELRILFYSPVAWFILVAFLIQTALTYFGIIERFVTMKEMGGEAALSLKDYPFTSFIFGPGQMGLSADIMNKLYFYLPLITMSLLARETDSGTIKLLYSSPLKIVEIVGGKFLAMVLVSFMMTAVIGIFMFAGAVTIQHADVGLLCSTALAFFLVLCTYAAIGLFMSSLTSYQVVAAMITFGTIALLTYINSFWQDVDLIRDLTYFLSINGRAEDLLSGLIVTKNVIYFIVIIWIFLGFTYLKLHGNLQRKPILPTLGRYIIVVTLGLGMGYLSSRPVLTGYWDVTMDQHNRVVPEIQQLLKEMDAPLEIHTYNNILSDFTDYGIPENRNSTLELWSRYLRFKPDMDFKFTQFYDRPIDGTGGNSFTSLYPGKTVEQAAKQVIHAKDMIASDFKTPEEIRKVIDLKPELNRYVMQLKYKGKSTFLRVYNDNVAWPEEAEVGAALKRLLELNIPKLYFLTGNLERSITRSGKREYQQLAKDITYRNALVNQGFDTDTLSLDHQDIPKNATTLIIADPKTALSSISLHKIKRYVDEGGNLLIAGEPGTHAILNPLLQQIGVQLKLGNVVQTGVYGTDYLVQKTTLYASSFTQALRKSYHDKLAIVMPSATGITYSDSLGFTINPLLVTTDESWLKMNLHVEEEADLRFNPTQGDIKGPFLTAVSLSRKIAGKEQRIVVTGDADFMSNDYLRRREMKVANLAFSTAVISWLNQSQFPVDALRPDPKDNAIALSARGLTIWIILLQWTLPGIVAITGTVILIRRKRK